MKTNNEFINDILLWNGDYFNDSFREYFGKKYNDKSYKLSFPNIMKDVFKSDDLIPYIDFDYFSKTNNNELVLFSNSSLITNVLLDIFLDALGVLHTPFEQLSTYELISTGETKNRYVFKTYLTI